MTTNKKTEDKPVDNKLTKKEVRLVKNKIKIGDKLLPSDFQVVLRKTAKDLKEWTLSKEGQTPIEYIANRAGVESSALNSYYFTSFGIFQKDIEEKVNPYIAFTTALIHAINLGLQLGEWKEGGEKNG